MSSHHVDSNSSFPIRELSARTQVNTVTLRAWERRYGLLKPQRTSKGHRLYSDQDVAVVEKILALVARGVQLGKVKPLLTSDISTVDEGGDTENWQQAMADLVAAIESFSVDKVDALIKQCFANYPTPICRERLIEPVFAELSQRDDHGAMLGFAESELLRYALMRLNTKGNKKKGIPCVTLIAGQQAPLWSLSLMALELADVKFSAQLLPRFFSVDAGINLAAKLDSHTAVFYQDGTWKPKERDAMIAGLRDNTALIVCGTAPVLAQLDHQGRVFADVKSCINGLLDT